jgi:TldD protein
MKKIVLFLSCLLFLPFNSLKAETIDSDVLLNSMEKELNRSYKNLKNAEEVPLYFLAYEIADYKQTHITAVIGGLFASDESEGRKLTIDVRVGSRSLDNYHRIKGYYDWQNKEGYDIPKGNSDEHSVRDALWRNTDKEYKKALEQYKKVIANKGVTAKEEDDSPDFSAERKGERFYEEVSAPQVDKKLWEEKVKKYSSALKKDFITYSYVAFDVKTENRFFVDTEGSKIRTGNVYISLRYSVSATTQDGMEVERVKSYHGFSLEDIPSDEVILSDIQNSLMELKQLKSASEMATYIGPVILRNRASAVFFHEIFGHRIEGDNQKDETSGQTFTKKVGQQVVSNIVSIYDDPTLERFNGVSLRGYYKYDDEGTKAERVTVVKDGILKNFLMSRTPIKNFPISNGHGRRAIWGYDVVSRMGNTIVEIANPVSYKRLREMLIEECRKQGKNYGFIFDDISGGFTFTGRGSPQSFKVLPLLVHKVYIDGKPDEIVRGVDIVGTPLTSFSKIIAGADDPDVFNGTCGAESGYIPVSAISPSILISEMELEKSSKHLQKPPILKPPFADKKGK